MTCRWAAYPTRARAKPNEFCRRSGYRWCLEAWRLACLSLASLALNLALARPAAALHVRRVLR
jgi:hypothetical protein